MSLSVAVIDALLATGASREQIAAAVKADIAVREAEETARLEAKRQNNRDRQQRKRERDRNAESRVTAVTARDERDPAPNERDILTPTREEKPKAKALVKKRCPIPDDWQPAPFSPNSESRKVVDSWPPGEEAAQLEQMKAYHRSKHNTFLDPQDAWSTWVLNTRKWGIGRHERSSNPTGDAVSNVLRRLGSDDRARQDAGAGRA
jgi:hypothetical protein